MFEISRYKDGYVVYSKHEGFRTKYVQSYRNGKYKFTLDYTYAKKYTEGTAICHMNALNERS